MGKKAGNIAEITKELQSYRGETNIMKQSISKIKSSQLDHLRDIFFRQFGLIIPVALTWISIYGYKVIENFWYSGFLWTVLIFLGITLSLLVTHKIKRAWIIHYLALTGILPLGILTLDAGIRLSIFAVKNGWFISGLMVTSIIFNMVTEYARLFRQQKYLMH